eukprot:SAG22_NODE_2104_length_3006_cov_2.293430_1_plen_162_part_00
MRTRLYSTSSRRALSQLCQWAGGAALHVARLPARRHRPPAARTFLKKLSCMSRYDCRPASWTCQSRVHWHARPAPNPLPAQSAHPADTKRLETKNRSRMDALARQRRNRLTAALVVVRLRCACRRSNATFSHPRRLFEQSRGSLSRPASPSQPTTAQPTAA